MPAHVYCAVKPCAQNDALNRTGGKDHGFKSQLSPYVLRIQAPAHRSDM